MAKCADCQKELRWTEVRSGGVCTDCYKAQRQSNKPKSDEEIERVRHATEIEKILLTTETHLDLKLLERIEIVTAECAFGMNVFKDLFAGIRDIVGGRSKAVQKTLRDTRRMALFELKKETYEVGAIAVIGVDLDYTELSAAGNMVLLVASGTAVRIDHEL